MHDVYAALFDPDADDLRARFEASSDVLVLDYVLLSPKWRGLGVGLLAVRKLLDLLGGGCGLVVSSIAPLNPDSREFFDVPEGWIPRPADEEARKKLRRYFGRMGFGRIGRRDLDGLSLSQVTTTLPDLILPEK
jgi:hypothetical protein